MKGHGAVGGSARALPEAIWPLHGLLPAACHHPLYRPLTAAAACPAAAVAACRDHDAQALKAVLPAGWGVLDAYMLTRQLAAMREPPYWDNIHFTGG